MGVLCRLHRGALELDPAWSRKALVDDVARVPHRRRLEQDDLRLLIGGRSMLDAARHDQKLARAEMHALVPELDPEPAAPDEEQLVLGVLMVPRENALHLDQLDLLPVQLRHYLGAPMLGEAGEGLTELHGLHDTFPQAAA
jgi:hypothetical protein